MANTNSAIRFDHREIAVIFSLFIFVALLMFTVGILVGKGLAQAQYSGGLSHNTTHEREVADVPTPNPASLGTSVSTDKHEDAHAASEHGAEHAAVSPEHHASAPEHGDAHEKESAQDAHGAAVAKHEEHTPDLSSPSAALPLKSMHAKAENEEEPQPALKLIPKKPGVIPDDPSKREAQHVMNDPKLAGLFEDAKGPAAKKIIKSEEREISSTDPLAGSDSGKYTLQIGSYPTKKDAEDRVAALKKLGFSYSYTSAKTLEGSKDTWYRVWLGYYPDSESAKKSGEALQARGEVKNYIVKKTDQQD